MYKKEFVPGARSCKSLFILAVCLCVHVCMCAAYAEANLPCDPSGAIHLGDGGGTVMGWKSEESCVDSILSLHLPVDQHWSSDCQACTAAPVPSETSL